ncbi:protein translocase subunit SecF [Candidatus Pantoea edessiphila]
MRWNKLVSSILGVLIISSVLVIFVFQFNWSIDFTGGTVIEINFKKSINIDMLRTNLMKFGFKSPIVQNLDKTNNIMIKIKSSFDSINIDKLRSKLISFINKDIKQKIKINRVDYVGPSIGIDLIKNGSIAIVSALIIVFLYIGLRFEWYISFGIVFALLSDIIITCAFLSLFHIEIDLTIIASLMSVIGYSLNDKIIIFDRIRENFKKNQISSYYDIINVSLTQVLNRTLMTSFVTLMMVSILLIFGGVLLKGFSLTMLIGIIIGTISSVYIALSLALIKNNKIPH